LVEPGLEAALRPHVSRRHYVRQLEGKAEAHRMAWAGGPVPAGPAPWTLRLLADQLIEWPPVPSISHETGRQALKKTSGRRTGNSTGRLRPHTVPRLWRRGKTGGRSTRVRWIRLMRG
jgi:hypothetical protein